MVLVDEREASANSRIAAIRLTVHTLRAMEYWRQQGLDYDGAMILNAVAAISSERLTRVRLEPELMSLAQPIPREQLARCNVSSLAIAAGLNRETARRKVNALIDRGLLERDPDGSVVFAPGLLQEEGTRELVHRQLDVVARLASDLLRDGVFKLA